MAHLAITEMEGGQKRKDERRERIGEVRGRWTGDVGRSENAQQ